MFIEKRLTLSQARKLISDALIMRNGYAPLMSKIHIHEIGLSYVRYSVGSGDTNIIRYQVSVQPQPESSESLLSEESDTSDNP